MASMAGLVWGAARLRGAHCPMSPEKGYDFLQKFKLRLGARRPDNIDRASLIKTFPDSPDSMSPEWRQLVYGAHDWVHLKCPFDRDLLSQCLHAVPCRSNSRLLTGARCQGRAGQALVASSLLGGAGQALLVPSLLGGAGQALQAQPSIFSEMTTRGRTVAVAPSSRALAIGEAVLQLVADGGQGLGPNPELERLLRQAIGSPRRGQSGEPTIEVFGSARRSPTKAPLALQDRSAAAGGQALPPAQDSSTPASGGALPRPVCLARTGSAQSAQSAQTPPSAQSASPEQAPPPSAMLHRSLLSALDQAAADPGTAAVPKLSAPAGFAAYLTATSDAVGGRKRTRNEEDDEAAAKDDGETAAGIIRRPAAARPMKRPAAMSKGKAPPARTAAPAKGKAPPAPTKTKAKKPPGDVQVRHEDLTYPGTKVKVRVHFGRSTIYTDLGAKLWRWKRQAGKAHRVTPTYSWRVEEAEDVWERMAKEVRAYNRR